MYRGRFGIIASVRRALAPEPPAPPPPPPLAAEPPPDPAPEPDPPPPDHRPFVLALYRRLMRREPDAAELEHWAAVVGHLGHEAVLERFFTSGEYEARHGVNDRSEFQPGHYYSPVVDPDALRASGFRVRRDEADEASLAGIDLRPEAMVDLWRRNLEVIRAAPFPDREAPPRRYYADNDVYAWGDALILLAMFNELRPRRVVEVGSGFSSACMLDICDDLRLPTRFTFVEPYPDRLYARLSPADRARCEILPIPVQQLPPQVCDALEADDILFIDSTHVSKTGSDVNHELFEILPRLKPGVVVHFHDTFYPFEYPESWIFGARRSWNELYILRAFLMDNPRYEVLFFNDYFAARHPREAALAPRFQINPGGGLWLRKVG
ncbi:class I SAM-dependent methyltransferase [Phenylobacterium sp.]|uniref:class I SAM-dependent methyltransferase n=1 Tax=Phenylobacterium sp. TaxID=1871053 RepID=UPI0035B2B919